MPQSSDELRAIIRTQFPGGEWDVVDCGEVENWLLYECGWQGAGNGVLRSPGPISEVPQEQYNAMRYLIEEWDYAYDGAIK